ncbi:unnamed protein product [Didymodactylos carnosus]|uniref:F-box protein n=1 Tax=Didymodactylos carnosus TaxID=1234261 RepID=A0A814I556_9BILA|nr:unnamed protein product [Didymodactylos carnosus]CAF3790353.1 unnamed protein product [Didymodactylos carnosus]
MIKLKLSVYESPLTMRNLLQNMPNLRYLTVETDDINVNGHQWKQIIIEYLPKLTVFRLKMLFRLNDNDNKEQRVDELLDSFRTPFWLEERQWFIRCDWNRCQQCDKNNIHLYTLPYAFLYYYFHESDFKSKSTCRHHDDYLSYNHVNTIGYELIPLSNQVLSHFSFSNLQNLDLCLPVDDNFWSVVPRFDQLISLKVAPYHGDNDLDSQSQLQALLDRAPCLYSLRFASWPSSSTQMPPFEYSNKSVRRLHLQDVDRCYDSQQCAKLSRSPLGIQCEVLSITVDNRKNVIDLINTMTNLRALNVVCRDDTWKEDDNNQSSSTEDELIEWLQHCLPSTCTITRNDDNIYNSRFIRSRSVRLWIR